MNSRLRGMKEDSEDYTMLIHGLQKTTLLDYPGKVACTVFFGGCDLRCPFCHNAGLVLSPEEAPTIPVQEFFSFLGKRRGILDGVCFTGGEPLMQRDIADLIRGIKQMGFLVKLDTNGTYPERLMELTDEGLVDYVAMDIKSSRENYQKAVGIRGFDTAKVERSAEHIMSCGVDYEFRTTAAKGLIEASDFAAIGEWLKGAKRYFIQAFRDGDSLLYKTARAESESLMPPPIPELSEFTAEELHAFADIVRPYFFEVGVRGID